MTTYEKLEAFCIGVIAAAIMYACVMSTGCTTMTPEQREITRAIETQNWLNCEAGLQSRGWIIVSDHLHPIHRPHRIYEIRQDLRSNSCELLLGKYWIEQ